MTRDEWLKAFTSTKANLDAACDAILGAPETEDPHAALIVYFKHTQALAVLTRQKPGYVPES